MNERFVLMYRGLAFGLAPGSSIVVGRDPDCDLELPPDTRVSRRHAKFSVDDTRLLVEDLGSRNGILVDGRVVRGGTLSHGSRVAVGLEMFAVVDTQQTRLRVPLTPLPYRQEGAHRRQMLTVKEDGTELDLLYQLLGELGMENVARERTLESRRAAVAIVNAARQRAAAGNLPDRIFERACRCFLGAAERTLEAAWLDRLFELHHALGRAIDGPTLFQLSRLTAVLERTSREIALAYLEEVGPITTDPAATSRMLRLRLLIDR